MILSTEILKKINQAKKIWLLLDYDGTLADFAPTPDDVFPDPDLINLLQKLSTLSKIDLAVISGRRLAHIEKLVPISDVWLAGSYGLELRTPLGERLQRADYQQLRPHLDQLKPKWKQLIKAQNGFYLEDKGWSLALHARFADDDLALQVLNHARKLAEQFSFIRMFQILGGHKFLEIAPKEADKGKTVKYLIQKPSSKLEFPIYLGDDDKDEKAFPIVQAMGGFAGCVCHQLRKTSADFRLRSVQETREWLKNLLDVIKSKGQSVTSDSEKDTNHH
jgi:trehalose 6-phosphate phosphatase